MRGINVLPGVYYHESVESGNPGDGEEIPVFIGRTNNEGIYGTEIKKYNSYYEVKQPVDKGGIAATGDEEKDLQFNPLLPVLKDFFEEAESVRYDDISVPYIYVIDVGDGGNASYWYQAMNIAKVQKEITMEVYYGLGALESNVYPVMEEAEKLVKSYAEKLDLRRIFFTIDNYSHEITDEEYINVVISWFQNRSRMNFLESANFGKAIARYCVTELGDDAGYKKYNTIEAGTLNKRTPEEALRLQAAGVIFSRDEYVNNTFIPRINLGVATSFCQPMNKRPADCLDSARRVADYVLNKIFTVCFSQIKRRESRNNLVKLQSDVDAVIFNAIENELVISSGTKLKVTESDSNPYAMVVSGTIQPINCTIAIAVNPTLIQPAIKAVEGL